MNIRRISFALIVLLSACGQQQSLELNKDEVFSKQFSEENLALSSDTGRGVTLKPMKVGSSSSSAKGFTSQSSTSSDYYGQGCNSIYGCAQNQYSYYLGYSNLARAWNPAITHTMNLNFGSGVVTPPVIAAFDPFAQAISSQTSQPFCVDLTITSSSTIQVLRRGRAQVSGSGTNAVKISARVSRIGTVILSLQDQQSFQSACSQYPQYQYNQNQYQYQYGQNSQYNYWQPMNWWDYSSYSYPECGAQASTQASLRIAGTAGPCNSPQSVSLDISDKINNQSGYDPYNYWNQGYAMPYFSSPIGVWGRVIQYQGDAGINFYGM